jgi:TP901 family phage tail tape measure protein
MNIGQLIATMGVDTAGLAQARRDMDRLETDMTRKVNSINARMQTIGKTAQKAGRQMSMYLTLPLTLAGGAAFKLYKDFDASMTKIVSLVGVAQGTVDGWRKDLLRMAPELGKAPAELADAMFFVTSAGIRGAAALDVLEKSAKASASGLGETKIVADLVTSAMNAYGQEILNAGQATDILVATVREGKAEAPALAASMGQVLPVASAMGVTFDQVGAAIASMTRTGTNAQTAAIQLRQILASLLVPSDKAEEALMGMGKSSKELREQIRDKGLLSVLQWLSTAVHENENQAENLVQAMGDAFPNVRALAGALDIVGGNAEENAKIFESLADATGAADYAFQKVTETAEFRWNKAIAAGKTALTEFGSALSETLIPVLEGMAERLQNLTRWFQSLDDRQRKMVITIAAVVAAAGPLLTIFGFLASSVVPGLIRVVLGAVKAFNVLKLALMSNPVGIILIAIAAATTAFVLLKNKINEVSEAQKALNSVNEEATRSIARQKSKVDQLFRIAESEAATLEQRKAAIDELNRISPEYLGNLSLENIRLEEGIEARKAYIAELVREAKVRIARDKLAELEERRLEEVVLGENLKLKAHQGFTQGLLMTLGLQNKAIEYTTDQYNKNLKETEKNIDDTKTTLENYLDMLLKSSDITTPEVPTPGGEGGTGGGSGSGDGGGAISSTEELSKVLEELRVREQQIVVMNGIMGDSFDATEESVNLYTSAVRELVEQGLRPGDQELDNYIDKMAEAQAILGQEKAATESVNRAKQEAIQLNKLLLDSEKQISDFIKSETNDIWGWVDTLEDIELPTFEVDRSAFDNFRGYADFMREHFRKMFLAGKMSAEDYYNSVDALDLEQRERLMNTLDAIASHTNNILSSIGGMWQAEKQRELDAAEGNQKKINQINKRYAKREKALALAMAIINTAQGFTKALAQEGPIGIITGALVLAAGAIQIATIAGQKLAKGGIVPPGYPNDTYPALLSSGETVQPPIPLSQGGGKREELVARISGQEMLFFIREAERVNENY